MNPGAARRTYKIFISILIGAALLRLININQSLAIDELLTIRDYVSKGFSWILLTYREPNNHILNSLLARTSTLVFGRHNWAYKFPSFLLSLWAVALIFRLGRLWFDDHTALAASALLGGSFYHILYSTQARGYSGMTTATLLALVSFTLAWREDKNKDWVILGVALAMGCYFLPFTLFPYLGCLICGIYLYHDSWINPWKFLITFAGVAVAVLLLYLPLWGQMEGIYRYRTGYDFLSKLFLWFVAGYFSAGPTFAPATIVYFVFFLLGLWYLKDWPKRAGVVLFFIIPVVALKYIIQPIWLFTRFFIFLLPLFLLIVAYGLKNLLKHRLWIGVVVLLLLNVPILSKYYRTEILPSEEVIKYIHGHAKPGEWIVGTGFTRLTYYYDQGDKDRLVWFERVEGKKARTFVVKEKNKGMWFIDAKIHDRNSDPVFSFRPKWAEKEFVEVGGRKFYFQDSFRGLYPLGMMLMVYYSPPAPNQQKPG